LDSLFKALDNSSFKYRTHNRTHFAWRFLTEGAVCVKSPFDILKTRYIKYLEIYR